MTTHSRDQESNKTILLLDVDGCLNPVPFGTRESKDWFFDVQADVHDGKQTFRMNFSKDMAKAIESLNVKIVWLTTWIFDEDLANDKICPLLGWNKKEVVNIVGKEHHFWKAATVKNFLKEDGPKVIWVDDEVNEFVSFFEDESVLDPHGRLITINPQKSVGITKRHISKIERFSR